MRNLHSIKMNSADHIRNGIIDRLMMISNTEYLSQIYKLLQTHSVDPSIVALSPEQKKILQLSSEDILKGQVKTQETLDELDRKWLSEL